MHEVRGVIACPICDTLHLRPGLAPGQQARCRSCGSALHRHSRLDRGRTLPLLLACLLLFVMANVFPIVSFELQGPAQPLTLAGAVSTLLDEGMVMVAMMVLLPTLLLPGFYLLLLLLTLLASRSRHLPDALVNRMVRMMQQLYPWSMVEVFLLGILVAIIKLSGDAVIILGPALWAWMGATMTLTVVLTFDLRRLVRRNAVPQSSPQALLRAARQACRAEAAAPPAAAGSAAAGAVPLLPTAASSGLRACAACDTVWSGAAAGQTCRRCGARLRQRRFSDLNLTWALLLTAAILYFPANLLPVMVTRSLFGTVEDTILSGVVYFWLAGEWFIASIIFIASFLIPLFKLTALFLLALQVQRRSAWRLPERSRLYHMVERIGRWSMLDVFVVAITSALVQRPGVAEVLAGPGIAAFGAVVVLTMLATMSFDPRLGWDARFGRYAVTTGEA